MDNGDLRLIVPSNFREFGEKVNKHLQTMRGTSQDYIVQIEEVRFDNGEAKIKILGTIRNKDVYILSDVSNPSITYQMFEFLNHKSPDDHFQDIKRIIYAVRDHSNFISVVTPFLYQSRQHSRKGRESLDCAVGLQDLISLNVKNIITFDAHDSGIQNAIPRNAFENFYPTDLIIEKFVDTEDIDFSDLIIVSPDLGAVKRTELYSNFFQVNIGVFSKKRDLTKIVDGKNPIIEHKYSGEDVKGKNVVIVDDMISSGQSILEAAELLKSKGAKRIYLMVTFALFTKGIELFKEAYKKGDIHKVYATNLRYIPEYLKKEPWFETVDLSYKVACIINNLNKQQSISSLLNNDPRIIEKVLKKIKKS